jgi:hypothetical protein
MPLKFQFNVSFILILSSLTSSLCSFLIDGDPRMPIQTIDHEYKMKSINQWGSPLSCK